MQTYIKPTTDPAHDVLRYEHQPLDAIFAPKNVAVIGATEKAGSVGRTILWNLISSPLVVQFFPLIQNVLAYWESKLILISEKFPKK